MQWKMLSQCLPSREATKITELRWWLPPRLNRIGDEMEVRIKTECRHSLRGPSGANGRSSTSKQASKKEMDPEPEFGFTAPWSQSRNFGSATLLKSFKKIPPHRCRCREKTWWRWPWSWWPCWSRNYGSGAEISAPQHCKKTMKKIPPRRCRCRGRT